MTRLKVIGMLLRWKYHIFVTTFSLVCLIISLPTFIFDEHPISTVLSECDSGAYRDSVGPLLSLPQNVNSSKYIVPNIAHYNWYSNIPKELKFHELLSLLSAQRIMKADKIFFHHNIEPYGPYWEEAKNKIPNLVLVHREPPTCVLGSRLALPFHETSNSNVDRIMMLLEFGGVYLDLDIVITRSLEPLRNYPTTLGLERNNIKGERVCGAFIMAAPHSTFMYIWANSMLDDYWVEKWAYITGDMSSKLIKRFKKSGIVHIEPTLLHRPNYSEMDYLIGPKKYDWSKNYAVHLWYRKWEGKDRFPTAESIKKLNSTFGEIARMVYYGSKDIL